MLNMAVRAASCAPLYTSCARDDEDDDNNADLKQEGQSEVDQKRMKYSRAASDWSSDAIS